MIVSLGFNTERRWKAVLHYRREAGAEVSTFYFEEIGELERIIERGPHWATIVSCSVTLNRIPEGLDALTVEQAAEL